MPESLSLAQARRIAIVAAGLGRPRPAGPVTHRQVLSTVRRLNLLQIDSVSVVTRAHYLPLFSRLGSYPSTLLDDLAWSQPGSRRRALFEFWAHEASLLPLELQPWLRWRMARAERGQGIYGGLAAFGRERQELIAGVLERIRQDGALVASQIEGPPGAGGWWGWSEAKKAVEWLFWAGRITTATRRGFARVYDLTERVIPPEILDVPTPSAEDAHRHLLRLSAAALGVATAGDLRDYFRLDAADVPERLQELVDAGELVPVAVQGWREPGYLHPAFAAPLRLSPALGALLVPFDPLVWRRPRVERLFGFQYRLEIYTPAAQRQHGYYVLPFLLGDRLVARVDLKSDRAKGRLLVQAAHLENRAPAHTGEALLAELHTMAAWLGLERVELAGKVPDWLPAVSMQQP